MGPCCPNNYSPILFSRTDLDRLAAVECAKLSAFKYRHQYTLILNLVCPFVAILLELLDWFIPEILSGT